MEKWNSFTVLTAPRPFNVPTNINPILKKKLLLFREELYKLQQSHANWNCLHIEAAALSRVLYRNYRSLRKDKGFQHLKMVMSSLNKYLRLELTGDIELFRDIVPARFSPLATEEQLPTRAAVGWLLARIQGAAALLYRIFQLTKRCGKWIYERLRLCWGPGVLLLTLGLSARIHVIVRFALLSMVEAYQRFVPLVRAFTKTNNESFSDYPRDLKVWLGGLRDVVSRETGANTTVDMVLDLVDLTEEDAEGEETQRDFIEIINLLNTQNEEDAEVKRIFEVVNLDLTTKPIVHQKPQHDDEDIGEPVVIKDVRTMNDVEKTALMVSAGHDSLRPSASKKRKAKRIANMKTKKAKFIEVIDVDTSFQRLSGSKSCKRI